MARRDSVRQLTAEEQIGTLEVRLAAGYDRIEAAKVSGQDIDAWQDFWIDLLRQYEEAVDQLSGETNRKDQ